LRWIPSPSPGILGPPRTPLTIPGPTSTIRAAHRARPGGGVAPRPSASSITVPRATSTAGPVSTARPSASDTVSGPPTVSTVTTPLSRPPVARVTAATAHAPDPHERVSPTPRAYTRIRTVPGSGPGEVSSTLTPCGN